MFTLATVAEPRPDERTDMALSHPLPSASFPIGILPSA